MAGRLLRFGLIGTTQRSFLSASLPHQAGRRRCCAQIIELSGPAFDMTRPTSESNMLSPRLPLWRVLKDEYESFHDHSLPLEIDYSFTKGQLKDPSQLALRLQDPPDKVSARLREMLLSAAPAAEDELDQFDGSQAPPEGLQNQLLIQLNKLLD